MNGILVRVGTVLTVTGVIGMEPELPDVPRAIGRGLIRHCGICDGYDVIGHRIGVLGAATEVSMKPCSYEPTPTT